MSKPKLSQAENQIELLDKWEASGYEQLHQLGLYDPDQRQIINVGENLPKNLSLAAASLVFLSSLNSKSKQTHNTYRAGYRRLMWFIHVTDRGLPDQLPVFELLPTVLEDFYLWLVDTYGLTNRSTIGAYLASARNLFYYLTSRDLSPAGVQYSKLVARLGQIQGRSSYKTPDIIRLKGRQSQIEQVVRLDALNSNPLPTIDHPLSASETDFKEPLRGSQISGEIVRAVNFEETLISNLPYEPGRKRQIRDEAEKARRQLEELRDRAIILTLFATGMRRDEVTTLNRSQLENLLVEYHTYLNSMDQANGGRESEKSEGTRQIYDLMIRGRGQKERPVYFDKVTLLAIEEYLALRGEDNYQPLFLQHHRRRDKTVAGPEGEGYRIGDGIVWTAVKKYASRLEVQLKPQDFRHTLASTLLNAGAQLSEVQDILGHANPAITQQIYAHYDKGHLKETYARFRERKDELSADQSGSLYPKK